MTAKTKKLLTTSFSLLLVALFLFVSTITVSAASVFPYTFNITNPTNLPFSDIYTNYMTNNAWEVVHGLGTFTADSYLHINEPLQAVVLDNRVDFLGEQMPVSLNNNFPTGTYNVIFYCAVESNGGILLAPQGYDISTSDGVACYDDNGRMFAFVPYSDDLTLNYQLYDYGAIAGSYDTIITCLLIPADYQYDPDPPIDTCPTLEQQIAEFDGSWYMFEQMLKTNNYELWLKYSAELADVGSIQYSQGLTQGYQNGYMGALSGNNTEDPIDQYWNSTKDYILIAGQPYFAPNGFGAIDAYNTIGIFGEYESKMHKQDGTTQAFNGQYVTEFASAGTLGGGWYKIGATVGDEYAYEQSFNVSAMDKAYYIARVSPLGDPVEENLVAIWLDDYGAWYVAEEFVHYGTVANNDKSYKQVYSIYMTDTRPIAQRFINYDNPTLYDNFDEDVNATLYLATFNQLNNYNVYTDGIGNVESYNNGFDAGANTTLWLELLSQPIVAFFSIPLAQVIVEGVTYTLTYGIVLGAGIVALIVVWFLKLFAGG